MANEHVMHDGWTFSQHMSLAALWVCYNSRSGKSTEKKSLAVMRQLTADDLIRMLTERNVRIPLGCERKPIVTA